MSETVSMGGAPPVELDAPGLARDGVEEEREFAEACARSADFPLVGIGASAGGLEALEMLFARMPEDTGMAFVVIQHLSPDFESRMDELLGRQTRIPIVRAENKLPLAPNVIYLAPPGKDMIVQAGRLVVADRDPDDRGLNLPIDHFFRSLAQDAGARAIAVVLSGTGSDGSRGAREVSAAGGLVVVQDDETAKFNGMPRSARETGVVDAVLPPEAIPAALLEHVGRRRVAAESPVAAEPEAAALSTILTLLRREHGIDFALYKPSMVLRRIDRRLPSSHATSLEEYADLLRANPDELNTLYRDLLIGVTCFFRDAAAFQQLEEHVIAPLAAGATRDAGVRVWVAGCATGEEAYSIAMLLHERLEPRGVPLKVFATDMHASSLEVASAGVYPEEALGDLLPARRARYFVRVPDGYQITPELRETIVFARHNVISDAPFTRLDLITCRNLLIYLEAPAQSRVLSLFHFALKARGCLFLGPSETPGDLAPEFEPMDRRWRIYRKRRDVRLPTGMPALHGALSTRRPQGTPRFSRSAPDARLASIYDALLERTMPPSFLVDDGGELLHTFGGAQRFLHIGGGRPSSNLLDLVVAELKTPLAGALQHASRQRGPVHYSGIEVGEGAERAAYRVIIEPFRDPRTEHEHFLVSLERVERPSPPAPLTSELDAHQLSQHYIASLEADLKFTRENLQATIEELQTSNEELQATNEELVAANEELQSTNEELHSVNEELFTVNTEHQRKIGELTEMTDDLDNLLESSDIAVVFLDESLRLRKFTAKAAHIFRLVPHDVGREFEDFAHALDDPDLISDAKRVLGEAGPVEREVAGRRGELYLLRALPYRTKSSTRGVVVTFIDVSSLKQSEADVQRLSAIVEHSSDAILGIDFAGRIVSWNEGAHALYGYSREEAVGQHAALLLPADRSEEIEQAIEQARRDIPLPRYETVHMAKRGAAIPVSISVSPIRDQRRRVTGASLIARDVSEQRMAEEQIRRTVRQRDQFLAMLSHELRNPLAAMLSAMRLIDDAGLDAPMRARSLAIVKRQAQHMARLLDDALDVSRMRQDRIEMRKEVIDLRETVESTVEAIQPRMRQAELELVVELPAEPVQAHADPARIAQVWMNLLMNATKYTPGGRRVTLTLEGHGAEAVVTVKDEGIGIARHLLTDIFEPFVQTEHDPRLTHGGMGLGLAIVKSIVSAHGGSVEAYSEGSGRGSTFTVRLPRLGGEERAEDSQPSRELSVRKPRKLLLVEDQDDGREMLRVLLGRAGYHVIDAATGNEAMRALAEHRPEVAIVDIGLPDTTGYEVGRFARQELGRSLLLIALTGYGQQRDRAQVLAAGFDHHLVKPVDLDVLTALLDGARVPAPTAESA